MSFSAQLGGPAGQQAEQVAQVGPGLDGVHPATGEQRDERGVHLASVVVAVEQPVLPPDDFTSESLLAAVVVQRQAAVLEETLERGALVERVADGLRDGRVVEGARRLGLAPGEAPPSRRAPTHNGGIGVNTAAA
jgi:hypothetical protein